MHDPGVVRTEFGSRRSLGQAGLGPVRLDPPIAEHGRRHAVERRGLVQADEGIRVQPVSAGTVPTVDQITVTFAWSISASVNAIPAAPAPITR